jgi:hypothetical protein
MGPDFVRHFGRRWQRHLLQQLLDQERAETFHLPSFVIPRDSVQRLRAGILQVNPGSCIVILEEALVGYYKTYLGQKR